MRAAAEAAGPPGGGPEGVGPSDVGSFRLKPGETLRLPAVKVSGRLSSLLCIPGAACAKEPASNK